MAQIVGAVQGRNGQNPVSIWRWTFISTARSDCLLFVKRVINKSAPATCNALLLLV